MAVTLTDQDVSDESQVAPLLEQIEQPIEQVTADGAYDGDPTYQTISAHGSTIAVVIPPREYAVPSAGFETDPSPRDTHLFDDRVAGPTRLAGGHRIRQRARWSRPRWAARRVSSVSGCARAAMPHGAPKPWSARWFSIACLMPQGPTPSAARWHRRKPLLPEASPVRHASVHQRRVKPRRARYLRVLRTCNLMPNSGSISWPTAVRLHRLKSIFSCSGRLSMMRRWIVSYWTLLSTRPSPRLRPRDAGRIAVQPPV